MIIEFPELALQVDRDRTADLMRMAVAAGYRISIDHVGTSSTTFEYLGQLPLFFCESGPQVCAWPDQFRRYFCNLVTQGVREPF